MPRLTRTVSPLCPIVAAMAAPTPIGAKRMTNPVNLNITCERLSQNARTGFPFSPTAETPMANRTEKATICSTSPRAMDSIRLAGKMWTSVSISVRGWFCAQRAQFIRPGMERDSVPGADDVDDGQTDKQGESRHNLKIDQGLYAHPPDPFQVSRTRNAHDDAGEEEGSDDGFDQIEENGPQKSGLHSPSRAAPTPGRRPPPARSESAW